VHGLEATPVREGSTLEADFSGDAVPLNGLIGGALVGVA
jgi:hypothetical protein